MKIQNILAVFAALFISFSSKPLALAMPAPAALVGMLCPPPVALACAGLASITIGVYWTWSNQDTVKVFSDSPELLSNFKANIDALNERDKNKIRELNSTKHNYCDDDDDDLSRSKRRRCSALKKRDCDEMKKLVDDFSMCASIRMEENRIFLKYGHIDDGHKLALKLVNAELSTCRKRYARICK